MAHSPRTASLIVLLISTAAAVSAQADGRPRVEAAVAYTTNLIEDENGTMVSYALAPAVGAAFAWTLSSGTNAVLGGRLSRAGVDVDFQGSSQSAGNGWVVDVRAALEREFGACSAGTRGCTVLHAGGGALWATGPDDVAPFSTDRGAMLTGEIGIAVRVTSGMPFYLTGVAQAFRLGGSTASDPIRESGTVTRVLLGVRHGR